jgi:hypothetical protein
MKIDPFRIYQHFKIYSIYKSYRVVINIWEYCTHVNIYIYIYIYIYISTIIYINCYFQIFQKIVDVFCMTKQMKLIEFYIAIDYYQEIW